MQAVVHVHKVLHSLPVNTCTDKEIALTRKSLSSTSSACSDADSVNSFKLGSSCQDVFHGWLFWEVLSQDATGCDRKRQQNVQDSLA